MIEVRVLGPVGVVIDGEVKTIGSAIQRTILALLAIQAPRAVSADRILEEVWGENGTGGRGTLQVHMSKLRRFLESEREGSGEDSVIVHEAGGYRLEMEEEHIDAKRFEGLVDEASAMLDFDPADAARLLAKSLDLFPGEPALENVAGPLLDSEAERLALVRARALELSYETRLLLGEYGALATELPQYVEADPPREGLVALLMQALYHLGRHVEAGRTADDYKRRLRELGYRPTDGFEQLHTSVLQNDLQSPGVTPAPPPAVTTPPLAFLFTDIVGSTRMWERDEPEMVDIVALHTQLVSGEIAAASGSVFKVSGDGVVARFASSSDAVRAAVAIQRRLSGRLAEFDPALPVRIGIHVGPANQVGDDYIGPHVNRAARVMDAAHGGQILVTEEVDRTGFESVSLGEHYLRDVSDPIGLHQIVADGIARDFPQIVTRGRADRLDGWAVRLLDGCSIRTPAGAHFEVSEDGATQRLIARLALNHDRPLSPATLAPAMWPEGPNDAGGAVEQEIAKLEASLANPDPSFIFAGDDGYRLTIPRRAIDIHVFVDHARQATVLRDTKPIEAAQQARIALELVGRPVTPLREASFAPSEVAALEDLEESATEVWLRHRMADHEPGEVLEQIEPALKRWPLNERLVGLAMNAHARLGDLSRAGRVFEEYRVAAESTDRRPSEQLQSYAADPFGDVPRDLPVRSTGLVVHRRFPRLRSSMVDRTAEVRTLIRLVEENPLLTLAGLGGLGKTTLAVQALSGLRALGREVRWVDLLKVKDWEQLVQEVASGIRAGHSPGLTLEESVLEVLSSSSMIVVLDNCEHVLDGVSHLLERAFGLAPDADGSDLRVLATSRFPLGLDGEYVWTPPPLTLPKLDDVEVDDSESIRLIRMRGAPARQAIDGASAGDLAELAEATGGLPLLCEAVSGMLADQTVSELAISLREGGLQIDLSAVSADRHDDSVQQMLRSSIDRLNGDDRALLLTAAATPGPVTVDALAAHPDFDTGKARAGVGRLVVAGLVEWVRTGGAGTRAVQMRQPVRLACQTTPGYDEEAALEALTSYYAGRARVWGRSFMHDPEVGLLISANIANIRAAIEYRLGTGTPHLMWPLVVFLELFWLGTGRSTEARRYLDEGLSNDDRPLTAGVGLERLNAMRVRGSLASFDGDYAVAVDDLRAATEGLAELVHATEDAATLRRVRIALGWARFHLARTLTSMIFTGQPVPAGLEPGAEFSLAMEAARLSQSELLLAWSQPFAGWYAAITGGEIEGRAASKLLADSVDFAEQDTARREPLNIGHAVRGLAYLAEGEPAEAAKVLRASVEGLEGTANRYSLQIALSLQAVALFELGDHDGARQALAGAMGHVRNVSSREFHALSIGIACMLLAAEDRPLARTLGRWLDETSPAWPTTLSVLGVDDVEGRRDHALSLVSTTTLPTSSRQAAGLVLDSLGLP